jgi:4-hydroxy-2-oxoheptanedioate aldolase
MNSSIVKRKLRNNEPVLAVKVNFMSPAVVEMMGLMGYDCLWLGNEHLYADISRIDHMVTAARAAGMDAMIRRNIAGYHDILQPLEMGVHGFMIPRVRSVAYLETVVENVKFPPVGKRGLDGVNADADFGLLDVEGYIQRANTETFIVAQIEDREALEILDGIAAVPEVDVIFIGHGDLSLSLGIPGRIRDERIIEAVDSVAEVCARNGKTAGIPSTDPEDAERLMSKGFRFFTAGGDYKFVKNGLLRMKEGYRDAGFTFR